MVTEFNSVHKHSESPPNVRRSEERDHSRLPVGSHDPQIQAIIKSGEPKKWTKLYFISPHPLTARRGDSKSLNISSILIGVRYGNPSP